jgi:hypothetical protein
MTVSQYQLESVVSALRPRLVAGLRHCQHLRSFRGLREVHRVVLISMCGVSRMELRFHGRCLGRALQGCLQFEWEHKGETRPEVAPRRGGVNPAEDVSKQTVVTPKATFFHRGRVSPASMPKSWLPRRATQFESNPGESCAVPSRNREWSYQDGKYRSANETGKFRMASLRAGWGRIASVKPVGLRHRAM